MNKETIRINSRILKTVKFAIEAAIDYENMTKRKLGITGEVGEILVCARLGLELIGNPRSEGFDAIDKKGNRVQIKTRRSESDSLPNNAGGTSRFSNHRFDYAVLGLLDRDYKLCQVWRAEYKNLKPLIERSKRRDLSINSFKKIGKCIYPRDISKSGKYTSIRHLMEVLFTKRKNLAYEIAKKSMLKEYPNSAFDKNHFSWYKTKIVTHSEIKTAIK